MSALIVTRLVTLWSVCTLTIKRHDGKGEECCYRLNDDNVNTLLTA